MLSISPIVHKGELIFYLANLLDYTTQMRSVAEPRGFCRSSAFHQRCTPLLPPALQPGQSDRMFATPAVFEAVDSQTPRPDMHPAVSANTAQPPRLQPRIRRLGWFGLTLEPEHLEQRIVAGVPDVKAARHFFLRTGALPVGRESHKLPLLTGQNPPSVRRPSQLGCGGVHRGGVDCAWRGVRGRCAAG
jgi:hypothetical protein